MNQKDAVLKIHWKYLTNLRFFSVSRAQFHKGLLNIEETKTQNRLFYDPSLTHKGRGGSGGKSDQLHRLFTYGFPITLNTF